MLGGALSTAGLVALVYGDHRGAAAGLGRPAGPGRGWGSGRRCWSPSCCWERRYPYPMIDLGLFRRPRFLWGTVAATIGTFGLFGLLFTVPQYLQAVQGQDAFATGLRLLPMMGGLVLGAGGADRIVARSAPGSRSPSAWP